MPIKRYRVGDWLDSPLSRRRLDLSELREERALVEEIVRRVAAEGDPALREYGRRFDGWAPAEGDGFGVGRAEMERPRRSERHGTRGSGAPPTPRRS